MSIGRGRRARITPGAAFLASMALDLDGGADLGFLPGA